MRKSLKTRLRTLWRKWASVLVVVVVLCSLRSAVADWNDVPTGSMKPSILEGDRIYVNKLAYGLRIPFTSVWLAEWEGPQRGDVVVLLSPENGSRLVKRVVGLPGDTLELRDNRLLVNGTPATYEPVDPEVVRRAATASLEGRQLGAERIDAEVHPVMITPGRRAPRWMAPVTVPPGQYFVMGDNRDESRDSRIFGLVPRHNIVGRASAVAISFDPDNYYRPRWNRFFSRMP